MTYTLIGTGNMAWFLATALKEAGYECMGVWGRTESSAAALAQMLGCAVIADLGSIKDEYDCCILAVTDHIIGEKAAELNLVKTPVVHTAGAVSLDVIPAPNRAVLWLIYSILKNDVPGHRNIPALVEANTPEARKAAARIARVISDMVHEVTGEQRQWLHLSAVMGNNFTNHLMTIVEQICKEQGVSFTLMLPILHQTFSRTVLMSPRDSQTGPARRGDDDTIARQTAMLENHPEFQKIYAAISASIEAMYKGAKS
jgi:predicted short-subunit dehydrogenase-like oxidoreductase (DUF2520 family)